MIKARSFTFYVLGHLMWALLECLGCKFRTLTSRCELCQMVTGELFHKQLSTSILQWQTSLAGDGKNKSTACSVPVLLQHVLNLTSFVTHLGHARSNVQRWLSSPALKKNTWLANVSRIPRTPRNHPEGFQPLWPTLPHLSSTQLASWGPADC